MNFTGSEEQINDMKAADEMARRARKTIGGKHPFPVDRFGSDAQMRAAARGIDCKNALIDIQTATINALAAEIAHLRNERAQKDTLSMGVGEPEAKYLDR